MTAAVHPAMTADRGRRLPYNAESIPQELRDLDRWVRFDIAANGSKLPRRIGSDALAKSDEPRDRCPFAAADADAAGRARSFPTFVLDVDLPYVLIDLDDVVSAGTGAVRGWARDIVERLDSYTEVSASGTGLHVVCRGPLPPRFTVPRIPPGEGSIEVYPRAGSRFVVMTGNMRPGLGSMDGRIEERADALAALFPATAERAGASRQRIAGSGALAPGEAEDIIAILTRNYVPGRRHHVALYASGWMAQQGVPEAAAVEIIGAIAAGDDDGGRKSIGTAEDSYEAHAAGETISGYHGLHGIGVPETDLKALDAVLQQCWLRSLPARSNATFSQSAPLPATNGRAPRNGDDAMQPVPAPHTDDAAAPARPPLRVLDTERTAPARSMVKINDRGLADLSAEAWRVLTASNDPPRMFRYGELPVRIVTDNEATPAIETLDHDKLRYELAETADWCRVNVSKDGSITRTNAFPPMDMVKNMRAAARYPLPALAGLIEAPAFAPDGSLPAVPGYHAPSRSYYWPAAGFEVPPIPERPTRDEIAAAAALLTDDLLVDFPFVGYAERAHAVAMILLPFLRGLISGPTPLHLIEKPTVGTGATLLASVMGRLATGREIAAMTEARDDEEWRKRLTAKLRTGDPILLIDNLRRQLDSAALAAALTASHHEDRILSTSDMVRVPVRCVWVATGNNPALSSEMTRRTVRIRLDAQTDRPFRRDADGFKHPHLEAWTDENRGRLVAACLTLGQAWIAAGRPAATVRASLGSYEAWARVVGGVLDVAGIAGFLSNMEAFYDQSDTEGAAIRAFLSAWHDAHQSAPVGVASLFTVAAGDESLIDLGNGTERSQRSRLGRLLVELRDRRYTLDDGRVVCIASGPTVHHGKTYRLMDPADMPRQGVLGN